MSMGTLRLHLADESATAHLGGALAIVLQTGNVLAINGDLGVGKSSLCRALIRTALDSPLEECPSPTFTLAQTYQGPTAEYHHFDFYRLQRPEDAFELGIEDAFASGVSLIEWPSRLGGGYLPGDTLTLTMAIAADGGRDVTLTAPAAVISAVRAAFTKPL